MRIILVIPPLAVATGSGFTPVKSSQRGNLAQNIIY